MAPCIQLSEVVCRYPEFSLVIPTLQIPSGSITAMVGRNGAGKSTLIEVTLGLITPDSGNIEIMGHSYKDSARQIRENVGAMLDKAGFPPSFTGRDVDKLLRGIYETWSSEKFFQLLHEFNVPASEAIASLSKGTYAKLRFCACVSHDPTLLVMDEATCGLDPTARSQMLEYLQFYSGSGKGTILFSTHLVEDVLAIADNVVCLKEGRLEFSGSLTSLIHSEQHNPERREGSLASRDREKALSAILGLIGGENDNT